MLFPQLGPQYWDEKDKPILSRMEAFYAEAITINMSFWGEADTDTRFEVGDQTLWSDLYGNLPANRKRQFSFNRIRRVVNMIGGHQRRNRKSTIVTPVENGDEETSDQFTKVMMWSMTQDNVLPKISEAFHGALVTGMNLLQVWMDYRSDPVSGNLKVDVVPYNGFLIDPYFRKRDLSDCNALWKRSFVTKREAISLLPANTEELLSLVGNDSGTGRDGKFQFLPESYNYGYKNLLTYDEFYYRDYRNQKMLVDTQTGETMEWKSDDDEALEMYLKQFPTIEAINQEVPTVKLAIVVQGKVMYHGPNPMGIDQYPFVPVLGYYNPQMPYFPYRIQGVVRGLRDAQYLYNRRRIIELDILESQINSGWVYKENALVNPKDIFLSGQGRGLALKDEAQMTDVQKIPSPGIDPSMIQLSELLAKEIQEVAGVSDELLGFDNKDTLSGYHAMLKQSASTTTLQILFDQLDEAQKLLGDIYIDAIQANWTPGKIKKILEGEEPTPQFYNKAFGKYHSVVEEGLNTATQKQMQFGQMLQLHEAGVQITPEDLLEAATIQNKKKIVANATQMKQQAAQMQQMQMQSALEETKARTELAYARAEADKGLGLERESRVQENEALAVERRAQAEKDNEIALLNFVKALKEMESIDISHLKDLVAISQSLKAEQREANMVDSVKNNENRVEQPSDPAAKQAQQQENQQAMAQEQMNQNPAQNVSGL
jgi:hypothetical protein